SWEAIGEIHAELFADVWPTTTIVEVSALVDPALLVEVEADAIVTVDRSVRAAVAAGPAARPVSVRPPRRWPA
ncbi:MAG: hypothetical protein JWO67_1818, partial [Streptosporangiaceae bacterium]|nr:hypothetical protein [Streptosporangiaceae bacterium]